MTNLPPGLPKLTFSHSRASSLEARRRGLVKTMRKNMTNLPPSLPKLTFSNSRASSLEARWWGVGKNYAEKYD